jgi:hypothetical protein
MDPKARVFVPGRIFKACVMFWVRPGAYPKVKTIKVLNLGGFQPYSQL